MLSSKNIEKYSAMLKSLKEKEDDVWHNYALLRNRAIILQQDLHELRKICIELEREMLKEKNEEFLSEFYYVELESDSSKYAIKNGRQVIKILDKEADADLIVSMLNKVIK